MTSLPPDAARVFQGDPDHARKLTALFTRLVKFFEYKQWPARDGMAQDLAQETLRRGLRRMAEGVELTTDPLHYFWGVADNVAREHRRSAGRTPVMVAVDEASATEHPQSTLDSRIYLQQLLSRLSKEDREVFVAYHLGDRDALRQRLGVTSTALRVRVHRLRCQLEDLSREEPR